MSLYDILCQIFPRSYLAKLVLVALVGFGLPCGLVLLSGPSVDGSLLLLAFTLGIALAGLGFRAVLRPLYQLERTLADLEAGLDPPYDPTHGDLPAILVARVNRLISEAEIQVDAARRLAERDPLTGLLNRRGFERALRGIASGSLIALDLDWFKRINDRYGHAEGDRLLVTLAHLLQSVLRRSDLAARMGGEEFVVLLPGLGSEAAYQVAERVRMAVEDRLRAQGEAVTVSIGVVGRSGTEAVNWAEFLSRADAAVYRAKALGRNRVELSHAGAEVLCGHAQEATGMLRAAE